MKLRVNYKHLAAEFLVVVIGVAVALTADSWRENLNEIGLEAEYLERISSDLELGRTGMMENRGRDNLVLGASRQVLSILGMPEASNDKILENFFQASQLRSNQENQRHDVTYQELVSTGRFSFIRDTNLRQKIAEYYRSHEFMMDIRTDRNLYPSVLLRQLTGQRGAVLISGDVTLTDSEAKELVSEIRGNDQLIRSIRENIPSLEFALIRIDATLMLNSEVQNMIGTL